MFLQKPGGIGALLISTAQTQRNSSDFGVDELHILIAPNVQDLTPVSF
jgi:hypothetical protein